MLTLNSEGNMISEGAQRMVYLSSDCRERSSEQRKWYREAITMVELNANPLAALGYSQLLRND